MKGLRRSRASTGSPDIVRLLATALALEHDVPRLESPQLALASGLVAKVALSPSSSREGSLTYVPIAAVVEGDRDRASVFVLANDRAKRRAVRVAFIAADGVALAEGLAPGETIVTDGALYLQDDERIAIVQDPAKAVGSVLAPAVPRRPG